MKKHFTFLAFSVLFIAAKSFAQVYTPIAVTGYTLDAVAENTTALSTTGGVIDGSNNVLYSNAFGQLFSPVGTGLPNSGIITATNRTYQMAPYTGPNLLYIPAAQKDSLVLVTPAPYPSLSLLGFATEGAGSMSITVRFTDNTTQTFANLTLTDWFLGTGVIAGFDRANRINNTIDHNATNPKMFATDLAIACANQAKSIKNVKITNMGTNARLCFTALSGNLPAYSVTASTLAICNGSNVTLTGNGMTSYTWQPVGAFAGSNSNTINVTPSSTTSYTLDGLSTNGCPGSTVVTINVGNGNPVISFSGSSSTVCLGAAATASASGAYSYVWSNNVPNGGTFIPAATAQYTVTGTNGCGSTSAMTTITVTPLPVSVAATSTLVCAGTAATLTANGGTTYSWTPGVGTNSTLVILPTANTVYTLTGFTAGGCSGNTVITISTKVNPTLSIVGNTAVCNGNSGNLSVLGNAVTYTWNPGGMVGPSININPTATTVYNVTGTNAQNCNTTISKIILVYQNPILSLSISNPTVCSGQSSTLSAVGATTYTWETTSVGSDYVATPVITTTYNVTGMSNVGCTTSSMITVEVFEPVLGVSPDPTICVGTTVNIGAAGATSYIWNTSESTPNILVSPAATTAYTVTGLVDNQFGVSCNATSVILVSVNPNPVITAVSSPTALCLGRTATLTADGAGAGGTYTWTGGSSSTNTVINVSPISNISYTVNGKDVNGCKAKAVISLAVSPCTGIALNAANTINLSVYPNPNNGEFTIKSGEVIVLHITNELGQLVKTITVNEEAVKINDLESGVYFITGKNANGSVNERLIITK